MTVTHMGPAGSPQSVAHAEKERQPRRPQPAVGVVSVVLVTISLAIAVVAAPVESAIARAFFTLVIGGGAVATAGLAGRRAQVLAALALVALTTLQRAPVRPVTVPPSSFWLTPLQSPGQIVQHRIAVPAGTAEWESLWRSTGEGGLAALWVCARGPLRPEDGLQVWLNGQPLATLVESLSSAPRPLPTSVGFFRVPVTRAQLEREPVATVQVRRAPSSTDRPIDVCGTFTYRPTAGWDASAYFDGTRWIDQGAARGGRYTIELRFENAAGTIIAAFY